MMFGGVFNFAFVFVRVLAEMFVDDFEFFLVA
jgi:hypothetical protein